MFKPAAINPGAVAEARMHLCTRAEEAERKELSIRAYVLQLYNDIHAAITSGATFDEVAADLSQAAGVAISPDTVRLYYGAEVKRRAEQSGREK